MVKTMSYYDTLQHHGVQGQKWGVRRFQNPDGSLTEAGKKRFKNLIEVNDKYESKRKESVDASNKADRYLLKSGYLRKDDEYVKDAKRNLYIDDDKFKELVNKSERLSKEVDELGSLRTKELMKVANSHYEGIMQVGYDRTRQILKDYENYKVNNPKETNNTVEVDNGVFYKRNR